MKAWSLLIVVGIFVCPVSSSTASSGAFLSPKLGCRKGAQYEAVLSTRTIGVPPLTQRSLFFNTRTEESLKSKRAEQEKIAIQLGQDSLELPFRFNLLEGDEVTIRLLTPSDLEFIVPMCVQEFGNPTSFDDLWKKFPWQKPWNGQKYVSDWWDNFALPGFIYWSFRAKVFLRDPVDHSLLVATLKDGTSDAGTIGMVELSKQPDQATRNPSAYPIPLWYKEWYCRQNNLPPPNGWVTNLLIAPKYRGQGYSKLLMGAAEGVARTWGCTRIHLHCDANSVSGKVPQNLYKSFGYEMVEDQNSPYAWMGSEFSKKIYMIQGVALLYFRKFLEVDNQEG